MRFRGRDIFTCPVTRSGITFASELENRMAAAWGNYTYEAFQALDGDDQSATVAAYRASNQIDGVLATEERRKSKRSSPKG